MEEFYNWTNVGVNSLNQYVLILEQMQIRWAQQGQNISLHEESEEPDNK